MSELILVCPAEDTFSAARFGLPLAAAAYRAGEDGRLYRRDFCADNGGVMLLCGGKASAELARDMRRECEARGFLAVLYDTMSARNAEKIRAALDGIELILPEEAAVSGETALISTAVSGGTLEDRFFDAAEKFGADKVNAAVEISREYFPLAPNRGQSRAMGEKELENMLSRADLTGFSRELCCKYAISGAAVALYDDVETVREKILRLSLLGVRRIFLPYPELASGTDRLSGLLRSLS